MLQIGRRNLSAYDRSLLVLKLKPVIAKQQKQKQVNGGKEKVQQKSVEPTTTQKEFAKVAVFSHDTIHKVEVIEVQIGRMLREIPKASGGDRRSEDFKNNPVDTFETKQEATREMGFSPKQVSQFQRIADHEQQVIADAVLDAEVRIGELMEKVPKAVNQYKSATDNGVASTKTEVIKEAGLNPKQVERFQLMTGPEQKSAGQNKTSVKLSKTGNCQFGSQK